jgi:iron(III) transport system substrate-binding protein
MKNRIVFIVLLLMAAGALVACGGGAAPEATVSAPLTESTSAPAEPTSAPAEPGNLTIYSGRSETLIQPLVDQFAAETGIEVEVRYGSTAEMAGVLLEEGGNSPADIFYAQDPGGLAAVQAAGLFQPLPEALLSNVPARFKSEDGAWVGVSGRARVVAYNTEAITDPAAQLPADIYDFTNAEWANRLGWAPSNASFQAMVTAMRQVWGEEKTTAWLQGIQANSPVVFEGNAPIVEAIGAGEIDAGFVNHYYLYRFLAEQGESFPARNYFLPGGGPGSLIMVSGAGILNSSDQVDNARRFIEFLLSPAGQQYFATETFEYPVIESEVTLAPSLPPLAELDAVAADVPLADLADVQGTQDLLIELGIIE